MALPRRARQQADEERGHDGQDAVDEDCRDDFGLAPSEADERGRQAELDDAEPTRRDGNRAEQAHEGPRSERLDVSDLVRRDAEDAERHEQHQVDGEVPGERRERQHVPPAPEKRVHSGAEAHERDQIADEAEKIGRLQVEVNAPDARVAR